MESTEYRPRRWSELELAQLPQMRQLLAEEIETTGQFAEVIGDRCLIRFLRGHSHNLEKVIVIYKNYLQWRKLNGVDAIRQDIVHGGKLPPSFPYAADFLQRVGEQILISSSMTDCDGCPIAVETYKFSPYEILGVSSNRIDDYKQYLIYCLEYKTLVLEQLSEIQERQNLLQCGFHPEETAQGYGVILQCTVIRDLAGITKDFLSAPSKDIMKLSLQIAQENYPEILHKLLVVNAPWIFSTIWYFGRPLIDVRTAAKVIITSSGTNAIAKYISMDNIPSFIGGNADSIKETYIKLDYSEYGPLHFFRYSQHYKISYCYLDYYNLRNKTESDDNELNSEETEAVTIMTCFETYFGPDHHYCASSS